MTGRFFVCGQTIQGWLAIPVNVPLTPLPASQVPLNWRVLTFKAPIHGVPPLLPLKA